ncbi:MAG: NADH:ubiquinone reductase (Na(+)-transporting) subunit A, partial [Bacteroidales bacterium]|nr:NADH:ubiquinone reductase (Na(+)-transporting) subunit A [Bacteroidales bacterium]
MSQHIRIKKGLNIPIAGEAAKEVTKTVLPDVVFIKPTDFRGLVPKLVVKEGDRVLAGQPLFVDKARQQISFCSPCSGTVEAVVRGDKRKLLGVRVKADAKCEYAQHQPLKVESADAATIKQALIERGLWPMIQQRPYGIVANPEAAPKSIFISAMATAPLAADLDFVLGNQVGYIQVAINALAKLTNGGVHLSLNAETFLGSDFHKLTNVIQHTFCGPHPAGNVGVQINHISPINKGEVVWTVDLLSLATIGKCLKEGVYDVTRLVAVTGPAAVNPSYVKGIQGMPMSAFAEYVGEKINEDASGVRIISGNPLTG